ncbi:MAG: DUF2142 domain-containing protein [Actinobacteria bacterium]|nr:DUF2142 domain-containing protein [Actinomycetota bacterium]
MREKPPGRSWSRGLVLLVCAYALLTAAWVFSNPPYAAPDEWSHFVRAASIGHGQLIGDRVKGPVLGKPKPGSESGHAERQWWAAQNTRKVEVPPGRTPSWFACSADPVVPALCLTEPQPRSEQATWDIPTGNYQPFPYLLPAVVTRIDASPNSLDRAGRALKALLAVALLALALAVLWTPNERGLSALGLVVATTPMVLFLAGSLNPSGLEITGGIAFLACVLRLSRGEGSSAPAVWAGFAVSGVVLALSRGTAPLWVFLDLALFLALTGVRPAARLVRRGSPYSVAALAAVALAVLGNRVWEFLYGPDVIVDATPVGLAVRSGWRELPEILKDHVGKFDYLEFGVTPVAYMLWLALAAGLFTLAQLVGSRRERLVLWATLGVALVVPVLLVAVIMRHTGYGLQGRYVMAFSVAVPLLAGEIVTRRRAMLTSLHAARLLLPFAAAAGVVHVHALYVNARRFAVGVDGPEWFISSAVWNPPGGWLPWLALAVVAVGLMTLAPVLDSRRPPG